MNTQLQVIDQREVLGKEFRIYGDKENPLFLAKDVKDWIEHNNITLMLNNVDEDEKLTYVIHNSGQNREMWFLTEDGLYKLSLISVISFLRPVTSFFISFISSCITLIPSNISFKVSSIDIPPISTINLL